MQKMFRAAVPLLRLVFVCLAMYEGQAAHAAPAVKVHTVSLGSIRKMTYMPVGATEAVALPLRPLVVDGRQKEWTTGEAHDVTDRSFVIRRVLKLNDALPGEAPRWTWQPGPWLLVDRNTGHITALHLPEFDPVISQAVWYRDYAAYCGLSNTTRGGLYFVVAQLNNRKAVVSKKLGPIPQQPVQQMPCSGIQWQRDPLRVSVTPAGAEAMSFNVQGTASSLVEDGDEEK